MPGSHAYTKKMGSCVRRAMQSCRVNVEVRRTRVYDVSVTLWERASSHCRCVGWEVRFIIKGGNIA